MDATMTPPNEMQPPAQTAANPVYVTIPLRNDPGLISILGSMLGWVGADGAKAWQSPGTFHVSLCVAPDIDDKRLKKALAVLKPQTVDLESAGLNVFASPNGYALHLSLKRTDALMTLQSSVYAAFEAAGVEVSSHHMPEAFNPHVTLGYFAENPVQRIDTFWWARRTSALEVAREGYKTVALLGDDTPTWRFVDRFSAINPDSWFRILPLGTFERFGRKVVVTAAVIKEMVENFKRGIPDVVLPINAEHEKTEGKLGGIADVEARSDGLYVLPQWLESGRQKVAEGLFQYFSPEIVWSSDWEGSPVKNVLVGLALTNLPFFGKETALYSVQDSVNGGAPLDGVPESLSIEGGSELSNVDPNLKAVIKEALEEYRAQQNKPADLPADPTQSESYKAIEAENEQLKRDAEAYRAQVAEAARTARVEKYTAILGAEHKATAEKFAAMPDEEIADGLVEDFKALKAQANPALFSEVGASTPVDSLVDESEKFNAIIDEKVKGGMEYGAAMNAAAKEHPALWAAHRAKTSRGG